MITTNVVIAGLGGQGVLKASDILAEAAFQAGLDIKKSEIHGMSQRGGSVHSDVRFGSRVLSPMIPPGLADYVVVLSEDQVQCNRHHLRPETGTLLTPETLDGADIPARSLNVALLAILSRYLPIAPEHWHTALTQHLPEKARESNLAIFESVRSGKHRAAD